MQHDNRSRRPMRRLLGAARLLPCLAMAAPFAHVSNEKSGTVSVNDTATNTVSKDISAGEVPSGVVIQ